MPATIVESLCGTALVVEAVSLLVGRPTGITAAVVGHVVAIGGFFLGMIAPDGDAANTTLNWYYHRVMLTALAIGLLLLIMPGPRSRFVRLRAAG